MGLLAVIVSGLALSAAPIVKAVAPTVSAAMEGCRIDGLTSLTQVGPPAYVITAPSRYWDIAGTVIDPCGVNSSTSIRVETWFSGAQNALNDCQAPAVLVNNGNVCMAVNEGGTDVQAQVAYNHPAPFEPSSQWCAHSNHVWVATNEASFLYGSYSCDTIPGESGGGSGGEEEDQEGHGGTPIVMPLTNVQAFHLTSAADGVLFDLDGDDVQEQIGWTATDSQLAFLAYDRNGNGTIDNGTELFGDHTVAGAPHGFAALRILNDQLRVDLKLPAQADGVIDADDPLYARLLLWEDRNHNGISEASELRPLSDLYSGVALGGTTHRRRDGHGNLFRVQGWAYYRTAPGTNKVRSSDEDRARRRYIYDVIFVRQ
jgi:hypothetical protein